MIVFVLFFWFMFETASVINHRVVFCHIYKSTNFVCVGFNFAQKKHNWSVESTFLSLYSHSNFPFWIGLSKLTRSYSYTIIEAVRVPIVGPQIGYNYKPMHSNIDKIAIIQKQKNSRTEWKSNLVESYRDLFGRRWKEKETCQYL